MVWIDYAIIGIVGFSALISLVRGFLRRPCLWSPGSSPFSLPAISIPISPSISSFSDAMVRNGLAIAALFVATLILGSVVNYVVGLLVEKDRAFRHRQGARGLFWRHSRGADRQRPVVFMDTFTSLSQSDWWVASGWCRSSSR